MDLLHSDYMQHLNLEIKNKKVYIGAAKFKTNED